MKVLVSIISVICVLIGLAIIFHEENDANVVSKNISTAADQFEVNRRIVFYNGITGENLLVIEGFCSLGNADKAREVTVTCKDGPKSYKKHFLGISDNVSFLAMQVDASEVSNTFYRVVFKPLARIPDIEVKK